ncbi:sce7726 family protein [Clavibacter michiganensis]|uniref:sce7726 family protein n=1 Tax=Clavibacter michiganensis TaxID=28447 RepID=UPI0013037081|nr:sce7726 family protein [Clavibacter michiganensis subsp. michiganensis]UGY89649.1 sce7726 family protein [Clavibacter michiganensis]
MISATYSEPLVRQAAQLFSTKAFRPIVEGSASSRVDDTVRRLREALSLSNASNGEVVLEAFNLLSRNYRTEYYYRNLIASNLLVGKYKAAKAVMLNELAIGGSIADSVIINDFATVYEIKTEFDTPSKLDSQLRSYFTVFGFVNVVVPKEAAARYLALLEQSPAGVIGVDRRGRLSQLAAPRRSSAAFDHAAIFNVLRARERDCVLEACGLSAPKVPNGLRYSVSLELARSIPVSLFQESAEIVLRARGSAASRPFLLNKHLYPFRALITQMSLSSQEARNLLSWVESKETSNVLPVLSR